ncbi:MAG: PAS domain S-box protein [Gemmatimonadaceae bacterium]|nr:PAS domain S-box protein [Gemmatimonadaceae bacterium]
MSHQRADTQHRPPVQLDRLLALLPGVIYRCRAEPGWPMEFISSAVTDMTGYSPEEFLAKGGVLYGDLVHPEDRPALDAAVADSMREGRPFTVAYRVQHRNGGVRHVLEQGTAVDTDAHGRRILEGYIADVTASRGLAEQLEATQAEFRALFESAPGCYLVLRPDGFTIVAVSEAYLEATNTARQDLLHRDLFEVFPDDPNEPGADGTSNLRRSLERVVETKRADAMAVQRYPIPRPAHLGGGFEERYWSPLNAPVLSPDGRVAYIIHRVEDVTHFVRHRGAVPSGPLSDRALRMEADIVARSRELQKANEQLRTAQQRLLDTFESITDALFTVDSEWRFAFLNRRAEELLQRDRNELLGQVIWEAFPAAVGSPFEAEYRKAVASGESCTFTAWYPEPLNRWYGVTAYPSAQGLTVYFRDVTDERLAIEGLRSSEERFRLLSRATSDAIWDWDLRTDQLWWNENYETLFGRSRDAVPRSSHSWSDFIHPEDHDRVVNEVQAIVDSGGSVFSGEYRFLRADGSFAWVLDRGHVIRNDAGEPVRMIGGMTDLTQRILAETRVAEQAALLDQATDAILVRDLNHTITFWSRGAESVYGWSRDEAVGQLVWQLLYNNPAPFHDATAAVLEHGHWAGELEHVTRQGEKRTIFGRWTLMRDRTGTPQSVLAINSDVTEQRKVERQLLRSQRLESIGTLAGGIAHDLNNVLAPVLMSIDLLRVETNPEVRDAILDTIEQSTKRGADLVQQVLAFARGVEGQRTPTQVGEICRDVAKIARDTFPKNIEIRLDIEDSLPQVLGDPTQLHQVLLNLCVNSRDAMPRGGDLRITARTSTIDTHYAALHPGATPGRHVVVCVEDSGDGMPPDVLDKIFEPFFTTKELGRGTGLGLSTSQGIVRSHGGFLRAYSDAGHGTRMMIYLPAHDGDHAAAQDEVVIHLPRGQGELVLVVDDEPSVRQITRQTLEAFGYRVLTARDGAEAVSLFAQKHREIAVVLTDMMMPVMDGLALIQVLLRIQPEVRVIAASGLNANGRTAKAADLGIRHFLAKPYTTELLLRLLREVLDGPQSA